MRVSSNDVRSDGLGRGAAEQQTKSHLLQKKRHSFHSTKLKNKKESEIFSEGSAMLLTLSRVNFDPLKIDLKLMRQEKIESCCQKNVEKSEKRAKSIE